MGQVLNDPHVVIIGAGFAGLAVARGLGNCRVRVTVIDKTNHHLFSPLLYQVATAGLDPSEVAYPIRAILNDFHNIEVLLGNVIHVDPVSKKVLFEDRSLTYDTLVLATGAALNYFRHPEWEKIAPGLKTLRDASLLRERILLAFERAEREIDEQKRKEYLNFVIVGGGPVGVELAGAIGELAHMALTRDFRHVNPNLSRIFLLEAGERILPAFPESLSKKAQKGLDRLCVEVKTKAIVEDIKEDGILVSGVWRRARTIIWAAGVAASPPGKWINADCDKVGRIKVEPDLSVPGYSEIFAIGDLACVFGHDGKALPGLASVAMQEGRYVADVIQRRVEGVPQVPAFSYLNKGNLATIGRSYAVADLKFVKLSGWLAWIAWAIIHIFYLVGFSNRILVLFRWAWSYFTWQRGARLINS